MGHSRTLTRRTVLIQNMPMKGIAGITILLISCLALLGRQNSPRTHLTMFRIKPERGFSGAAISPDGNYVAVALPQVRRQQLPNDRFDFELELKLWDVHSSKWIASQQIVERGAQEKVVGAQVIKSSSNVQYCNQGQEIMLYDPDGTFNLLESQTLQLEHTTDTNLGDTWLRVRSVFSKVTCARNDNRAAVAWWGDALEGSGGGLVRVYDLDTGALLREWDLREVPYAFGDLAISPDGKKLAVLHLMQTPNQKKGPEFNLEILDVETGQLTARIHTGDSAGRVAFVGESYVATAVDTLPTAFSKPEIKLWDLGNGKLVRQFGDPRLGAKYGVDASANGKVLAGFVYKDRVRFYWLGFESGYEVSEQRIGLWDVGTGRMIGISPEILPIINSPSPTFLQVSANGNAVLVPWHGTPSFIYIFQLSSEASSTE